MGSFVLDSSFLKKQRTKIMFIDLRERERGRGEREKRERETSIGCLPYMPLHATNQQ